MVKEKFKNLFKKESFTKIWNVMVNVKNKVSNFVKERYPYLKYKLILISLILLGLFFIIHFSQLLFILIILGLALLCSFDFFNILHFVKEQKENTLKYNLLKKVGFLYIFLPFASLICLNQNKGSDFTFWILSLIIFNKVLGYVIDDVLDIDILSTKIYSNRTFLSMINGLFFSIFIGFIFSFFLKQNTFIFVGINFGLTLLIFIEEYFANKFKIFLELEDTNTKIFNLLNGFVLPILTTYVLYRIV